MDVHSSADDLHVGLPHQPRWFQPPPKVRIIHGILGLCPQVETRSVHPLQNFGGECTGGGDLESRHPLPGHIPFPSLIGKSTNPNPLPSTSIRRFVGHLWANPSTKPFVTAMRTEATPTIVIVMQPRGGGRRSG